MFYSEDIMISDSELFKLLINILKNLYLLSLNNL